MKKEIDTYTQSFASAWNSLDISPIVPLLDDKFHYSSFWVLEEMTTAEQYLDYLKGKFTTLRRSGSLVKAEHIPGKDFIILTQDNRNRCGIILTVNDLGLIARADMMPIEFCR